MSDGLFHLTNGQLVAMTAARYDAEDVLQALIEKHPDLLAGGQISPGDPRRWVLVKREQPVPDTDISTGRWSVDHLFVDQDAVPTLVEVKRSTDTRIRREVVGQMLDYAANGVRYWPAATLQAAFEATQTAAGVDPTDAIADLCDVPTTLEDFFATVETNLLAGKIRLLFVADIVPDELRRIVEFLNEQMSQAEVFAIEVKQYLANTPDDAVIVATLFGRTAATVGKSGRSRRSREEALALASDDTRMVLDLVTGFARDGGFLLHETPAALVVKTPARDSLATVYVTYDSIEFPIQELRDRGWKAEADALLARLQRTTTKSLSPKSPNVPSTDAVACWEQVKQVLAEMARLFGAGA